MDTNKLSDVLEMALKNTYVATTEKLLMRSGMCSALNGLFIQGHITLNALHTVMDYVDDFMDEMMELEKITDDGFMFLYECLVHFKGYDTTDLQYLVWETVIDKLRSEGR